MKTLLFSVIFLFSIQLASAQVIINGYAKVTNITGNVFTISTSAGHQSEVAVTGTFTVGGKIIIMQMQDNVIGANINNDVNFGDLGTIQSAGLYEVATITTLTRTGGLTSVTLSGSTSNTYSTTSTTANSSLQIITYPKLGSPDFTTTSDMTCLAWNGDIGGVLVFFVDGILTLQHRLNVSERGFRGGVRSNNFYAGGTDCTGDVRYISTSVDDGAKGEGIYKSTNTGFERSRGRVLSGGGGGNYINAGGGGGGNFSSGGDGGVGWNSTPAGCLTPVGGIGGISLATSISAGRVFMGGAGGGGQQNDNVGTDGGEGGGIILLKANELRTGATCVNPISITANGETMPASGNDDGGGGAGGSIVIQVDAWNISATCPITISGNGGGGSSINSSTHGGGGGGGQGAIFYSISQPSSNTTTTTSLGAGGCSNSSNPCDSSAGGGGGTNNGGIFDNAVSPLPVTLIYWTASLKNQSVVLDWATVDEDVKFYEVGKSVENLNDFKKIAQILPKNQVNLTNYQVIDKDFEDKSGDNFKGKTIYYRLKIVENDGTFNYSKVISINFNNLVISDLQVYPNPFENEFYIKGNLGNNEIEKITISDMYGRKLLEIIKPTENMPIQLQDYPKGTYLITIETIREIFRKKIIKIK